MWQLAPLLQGPAYTMAQLDAAAGSIVAKLQEKLRDLIAQKKAGSSKTAGMTLNVYTLAMHLKEQGAWVTAKQEAEKALMLYLAAWDGDMWRHLPAVLHE